jgi:predicted enzyme related to lactoylglutathione lyase
MASRLVALTFDAHDPSGLGRFWSGVLGRELVEEADGAVRVLPGDDKQFPLRFVPSQEEKAGPNQIHFDLTSAAAEDQQKTVARALELGARHIDVGQLPEEGHVVLADPEGNEFCVIEAGNNFLADTDLIGALSSDGSQAVGYFWSEALGWPLVWDQDQETAIQSPHGGTKITWGGPPVAPKTGRNRQHFDLAPPVGGDQRAEVERLLALGAELADADPGETGRVAMIDPDGNEFCVLTPR